MSASREKKQRQPESEPVLTQRQRKEQKEQQAAKRKATLYTVIGIVVAIAVAALLLWHNGVFEKKVPAAIVNGQEYSADDLSFYYQNALNQEYSLYAQYAMFGVTPPFDINKPLGDQIQEPATGKTWQAHFQELALENLTHTVALCDAAKEAGYSLSKEGQEMLDATLQSISDSAAQNGMDRATYLARAYGVNEKVFRRHLELTALASDFQQNYLNGLSYADSDLENYYKSNAADLDSYYFRYFYVDGAAPAPVDADGNPMKDADGNPVPPSEEDQKAAMAEAKQRADEAVSTIRAAADPEKTFVELVPDYVSESAKQNYLDDPDYSLSAGVNGLSLSGTGYGDWVRDAKRKTGDVAAVESGTGYYVLLFLDRQLLEDPTVNYSDLLIPAALADEDNPDTTDIDESKVPTQAALDEAKASAEELLAKCQAESSDFNTLTYGKATAKNHSFTQKNSTPDALNDWLFAEDRKAGDTTVLSEATGARLVSFNDYEGPYWKYIATEALKSTDLAAWEAKLTDACESTAGEGMSKVGR